MDEFGPGGGVRKIFGRGGGVRKTTAFRTIPQVLTDAARRDPDGIWIRTDEGTMTFGAAAAQVAATAGALHDAGVRAPPRPPAASLLSPPPDWGPRPALWRAAGAALGRTSLCRIFYVSLL